MCAGALFGCDDPQNADLDEDEFELEFGDNDAEHRIAIALADIDDDNPVRNAVVLIGGGCTGTLVAPDLVLTVAHCGWENPAYYTGGWSTLPAPVPVQFGPERTTSNTDLTFSANEISAPPLHTGGSHPTWLDDIVLLRLTSDVPPGIAVPRPVYIDRPYPLHPTHGSTSETIFQVGYGGGRDRRMMTGGEYRDWITDPTTAPTDRHNVFAYVSDIIAPGVGTRGKNIENGDSGGPMLLNDEEGFVFGVLSHWQPTGIATFAPGTGGRSPVRTWLKTQLPPQRSDFEVVSVTEGGCTWQGDPMVEVTIRNSGVYSAHAWVDVFTGLSASPSYGDLSSIYRDSGVLAPAESKTLWFEINNDFGSGWVDVILDTTQSVPELDEGNNTGWGKLSFPDCSVD